MAATKIQPDPNETAEAGARVDDHQLQKDILAELDWDNSVHAAHIGVAVSGGAVTLSGVVDSWPEKRAAANAVKRVRGVRVIADDLEVEIRGVTGMGDTAIAKAAEHALAWDSDVPEGTITATVRDHVLTLEGSVTWDYERRAAERAAWSAPGVSRVHNHLHIG